MSSPVTAARILARRPVRLALAVLLSVALGGVLAATMYLTLFDPWWITFLSGVLFAAVLGVASHASRSEWIVARRTRQLERVKGRLEQANARSASATEAFRAAEARLRALADAIALPVLVLDRQERCRLHNAAAARLAGADDAGVDGRVLAELAGEAAYQVMRPRLQASLAGHPAAYEVDWGEGGGSHYAVRHAPYPPGPGEPEGVVVMLTPLGAAAARAAAVAEEAKAQTAGVAVPGEHGETLYLKAIAREITGWDDPRAKLIRALDEDRFVLLEQRIVPFDLGIADALSYEVLLRLQEEEDNLLPPGGFLPEAERLGMMPELDRWVVRHLVTRCLERARRQPGWRPPLYCVNLSPSTLRDPGFAPFVQQQLHSRGFDGRALCFEIAEADVAGLPAEVKSLIGMLKPFGCRFTVDAFCSVTGSFAPLRGLAFDFIKIDGVVIQNLLRDGAQLARTRAIAAVCRKTGLRSIAEFVEGHDTLERLRRTGVDYVQGFGVSSPRRLFADEPRAVRAA
jgi:EAL domain-containing protein (putative c-di-GMP-specific phosphodiesterase class I)/PAS domain-containing protein